MFFIFFDFVLYEEGDETVALGPDGAEACPEDLPMDGLVSVDDILMMLSDFGCLEDCAADVDLDNAVTIADLLLLLTKFGEGC